MGLFGFGSNTVYYPGCFSLAKLKNKVENYKKILKKIGVNNSLPEDFRCCSGILINAGYDKEARKIARDNLELFEKQKIKKIITNCPLCLKTFSQDYKEMMPDWDIDIEHILITVLKKIKENPNLVKNPLPREKIIYHDPCYLGRYSKIYKQPRELLILLGYDVVDLPYAREESLCTGACGNLKQLNPELADEIFRDFIKQLYKLKINKIVTPDPYVYQHLKDNSGIENIQVLEFSDIICDVLGIRRS